MSPQIINNGNQTFTVLSGGKEVFTGNIIEAMKEHARLSVIAKGPARAGTKEQRRRERKEAGVR
jgi:hypothetical protein